MFEKITLYAKPHNQFSPPGPHWTVKTRVFCTGEINLGLGQVIKWGPSGALRLKTLIHFFKQLPSYRKESEPIQSFSFPYADRSIRIALTKKSEYYTILQIYKPWYSASGIKEELLFEQTLSLGMFQTFEQSFYYSIMQILTQSTTSEVCMFYGGMMRENSGKRPLEFNIGQRVTTILGPNVKTERTGSIISSSYHDNDKTNLYFLMVDGKVRRKRYLPGDLKKADTDNSL
jgi:hypothetical protein